MKKIFGFFTAHKCVVTWSLCYFAATWLILWGLFDFNIFSMGQWHRLARAHLIGFPGFVFGIMILAAVPLYIATTAIVFRTGKPLITIPMPRIPGLTPPPTATDADDAAGAVPAPATPVDTFPDIMPPELKYAFIRARAHMTVTPKSVFNRHMSPIESHQPDITPAASTIPLPDDFEFDAASPTDQAAPDDTVPTFTTIDFDAPSPNAPTPDDNQADPMTAFLQSQSIAFDIIDDIIVTDKFAIASHTDTEYWVADNETWFAPGVQIPSPVAAAAAIAATHGLRPVLYLGATNIMHLDERIQEWESMGVTIITSPNELLQI